MRFAVTVTLNIGLNVPPNEENLDPADTTHLALEALAKHLSIKRYRARIAFAHGTEAGTGSLLWEDTLIVEVQGIATKRGGGAYIVQSVYKLAERLGQDCIAFRGVVSFDGEEDGPFRTHEQLVGPNADAWGEFDPKLFIPFDGWQE